MRPPDADALLDARERLRPYLEPTPLRAYPSLRELVGADVWVKHDNFLPTGAFKVRGGINLVSRLDADERRAGVSCASTGNHGQSIAYAARLFGVPCTVYVPEGANPAKVGSIRELGAAVVEHGRDYDDARERCEDEAAATGRRYVHSGDEPLLIAGVATHTLELLERVLWELLADFVLVSEEELRTAQRLMIEKTRTLVEAAGASPLAAAMKLGERLRDRRVALICTGGNVTLPQLRELLA